MYLFRGVEPGLCPCFSIQGAGPRGLSDPSERHCQVGSLAGAADLLEDYA
ncbi:hypothetical protein CBR_g60208, partial [Chara braunii]